MLEISIIKTVKITNSKGKKRGYESQSWLHRNSKRSKAKPARTTITKAKGPNTQRVFKAKQTKKRERSKKFKRVFYGFLLFMFTLAFIGLLVGLSYIQTLTEQLPSPDKPFGKQATASEIYDSEGNLLYRLFADENRDPVNIEEVPGLLKWSFLAAEDAEFYEHPGVDVKAITRCGVQYIKNPSTGCGGSTITQQLIKITALTSERKFERKFKEVILALQIERERDKEEILEMYLTIAPEGSNVYGVTSAAKFYFDKELDELNLAEMSVLASIPQDPVQLSPTKSANPELAKEKLESRRLYVLGQMAKHMERINEYLAEKGEEPLTEAMIQDAKDFKLKYKEPKFEINSPHFVFYALKLLKQREYNDGEVFGESELETGGYKIYTTLNPDFQKIAEEQVKKGVDVYGKTYGASNASLVALDPNNGHVLAMAGSYDYFGKASPEGCTPGVNCKFEPQVNIADTLQSPGSSVKPFVYYKAIMEGLITPGSQIPDIPIAIGSYKPKNFEGGFRGWNTARVHLRDSRNIPPIMLLDQMGADTFVDEMKRWGFTSYTNPGGYGPAVAVGAADIKLIEHAQGYGVFANEGKLVKHEVISKIEDSEGNVIFEHKPKAKRVADERGVFLINDMLNGKKQGPGYSWDGRDVAGKTATSEDQKETLFATYTPEIVVVGWLGNNDNTPMYNGASGFGTAKPWISEYLTRVGAGLPPTPFERPAGIISRNDGCQVNGAACTGVASDLAIADIKVPVYIEAKEVEVCTDQEGRLARDIDRQLNRTKIVLAKQYKSVDTKLQSTIDAWAIRTQGYNGIPTEPCDINRNPNGSNKPWANVFRPTQGEVISDSLKVNFNGYSATANVVRTEVYFDDIFLGEYNSGDVQETFSIGNQSPGTHKVSFIVTDSAGKVGTTVVSVEIVGNLKINSPSQNSVVNAGSFVDVIYGYTGSSISDVKLLVNGEIHTSCSATACSWDVDNSLVGVVTLQVRGSKSGALVQSDVVTVTVVP